MPGKYRITKTVTTESESLRTRIEIQEGDPSSPIPGGYYGTVTLIDERGNAVERQPLGPEELNTIVSQLLALKSRVVEDAGAVFVADERPTDIEDLKEKLK